MNTTLGLTDYGRLPERAEFDAWLVSEGIDRMNCFRITFGEGVCQLQCYAVDEGGAPVLSVVADDQGGSHYVRSEVERQHYPHTSPPESLFLYLALR